MSEAAAEFLGTMIFIIFGCGVIAQVVVTGDPNASAHPRGVSVFTAFRMNAPHKIRNL